MVIDFSLGVLGLAEGFYQEGFEVAAGVGFEMSKDMTWKVSFRADFSFRFFLLTDTILCM